VVVSSRLFARQSWFFDANWLGASSPLSSGCCRLPPGSECEPERRHQQTRDQRVSAPQQGKERSRDRHAHACCLMHADIHRLGLPSPWPSHSHRQTPTPATAASLAREQARPASQMTDHEEDMPDLLPPTWQPTQQQTQQPHAAQATLPFPSLVASGPGAWTSNGTLSAAVPAAQQQGSTASPRVAQHVAVPASLAFGGLEQGLTAQQGHSHDGVACGHSHAPSSPSHANHHSSTNAYTQPSSSTAGGGAANAHGHSHGGAACTGHDHEDHGHSHSTSSSSTSSSAPLLRKSPIVYEDTSRPAHRGNLPQRLASWCRLAWRGGGDSRHVLFYVGVKLAFMSLQFAWGLWTDNLGLVSSSFHTGFDVIALCCSLAAMLNAKYPPRHPYSYGFDRQEIVAAFTNAIFLFFVATFMIIETFHTVYYPPEVERDDIALAMLGFAMDLLGLALFYSYVTLKPQTELPEAATNWTASALGSAGRGHVENMHGVSLHVVADLVGHSSLLVAVWLNQLYPQATYVFALSFLFSAVLIIQLVLPLFQTTGAILLMTTPANIRLGLDRCIREISFYDGVLELRSAHWWTQAPGVVVGSLHIRIRSDASEQLILAYVNSVLKKYISILTVQVEKDALPINWTISNHMRSP
jgi:zinc transporter 5/7